MATTQKIERTLDAAMTAADIIERLQECDPESPVLFTCNYGDHCRTMQALTIGEVDEYLSSDISESAYSQSGLAFNEQDDSDKSFYCKTCDTEWTIPTCPKCKGQCVTEDGMPADLNEAFPVVILR